MIGDGSLIYHKELGGLRAVFCTPETLTRGLTPKGGKQIPTEEVAVSTALAYHAYSELVRENPWFYRNDEVLKNKAALKRGLTLLGISDPDEYIKTHERSYVGLTNGQKTEYFDSFVN